MNDSNNRSPAFQFYPKDFLSDEKQISMSLAAVGIYMRLICHCWNEGSLPADPGVLARLSGATKRQIAELWPSIAPCFKTNEDGRLIHPRLEREREKQQTFRQRQSDRATARWDTDRRLKETRPTDATAMPRHKLGIIPALPDEKLATAKPPQCSSSAISDLQSSEKTERAPERLDIAWNAFADAYPQDRVERGRIVQDGFIAACQAVGVADVMARLAAHKRSAQWRKGMVPRMGNYFGEKQLWRQELPEQDAAKPVDVTPAVGKRSMVPNHEPL